MSHSTRSNTRQVPALWNPHHHINLRNPDHKDDYTCLSWARTTRARCCKRIARGKALRAFLILSELELRQPTDRLEIQRRLQEVVELCTCHIRTHKEQRDKIVEDYLVTMPEEEEENAHRRASVTWANVRSTSQASLPTRSNTRSSVRTTVEAAPSGNRAAENEASLYDLIRCLTTRVNELQANLVAVQALAGTEAQGTRISHVRQPARSTTSGRTRAEREAAPSPSASVSRVATEISIDSRTARDGGVTTAESDGHTSVENANAANLCRETHVGRKPIEGPCAICLDDLEDADREEVAWCKGTCGQNAHTECILQWHATQVPDTDGMDSGSTCPFCRQEWKAACEHDHQEPTSVS